MKKILALLTLIYGISFAQSSAWITIAQVDSFRYELKSGSVAIHPTVIFATMRMQTADGNLFFYEVTFRANLCTTGRGLYALTDSYGKITEVPYESKGGTGASYVGDALCTVRDLKLKQEIR
jgi:hypothetical protein